MKLILVTGIEQTDKNKLLGMAVSTLNNGTGYKEFYNINFNGMDSIKNGFIRLSDIKNSYLSIYDELEKVLNSSKRNAFNIILDASFTLNRGYGYIPLITDRFFSLFKPDVVLLIENKLEDFKDNPREFHMIKDQQEINRAYCVKFASDHGIPMKAIRVNRTEIKATVKEIQDYLTLVAKN
ncbi:MAG: hypothetical protein HZB67_04945 [Candidatus Aenigmarchaeota archaeon]|nr:hypothetical protein [Candidatus Aenigmarchaeota archaeon]